MGDVDIGKFSVVFTVIASILPVLVIAAKNLGAAMVVVFEAAVITRLFW